MTQLPKATGSDMSHEEAHEKQNYSNPGAEPAT